MAKHTGKTQTYQFRNRQVTVPDGYVAVGRIASVHGLRGDLKVELHTDYPERFAPDVQLLMDANLTKITIESVRPHKGHLLIRFQGVYNRDDADELRGRWLFVDEDELAELDEDAYWVHDIIGLTVQSAEDRQLGEITDVLFTGANEVYVIKPAPGVNKGKDILLPALTSVIQEIDLDAGVMLVNLPDGLMEEDS